MQRQFFHPRSLRQTPHRTNHNPPPPRRVQQPPSPRRRGDVAQPPALTTSLGGLSYQGLGVSSGSGYGSAPNSTTSLSSPFSQNNPSALARLSGISGRETSPMAMRQSSGQAVPYNPLEWTSARGTSPQAGAAAQLGRASPQAYSDGKSAITAQESYLAARDSVCSV